MSKHIIRLGLWVLLLTCASCSSQPANSDSSKNQTDSKQDFSSQALSSSSSSQAASQAALAISASSAAAKSEDSQTDSDLLKAFAKADGLAQKLSDLYAQQGAQCSAIQTNEGVSGIQNDPAVSFTATLPQENNPAETAKIQIWICDDPQTDLETLSTNLENDGEMQIMSQWNDSDGQVEVIRNNRSNLNFLLLLDQKDSLLVEIEDSAPEILPVTISVIRALGYPLNDSFD